MRDQAALLRAARAGGETGGDAPAPGAIVVGSGKGGVGNSVLAVLIAASLARRGRRTLLVDGEQNQANLHILAGVRPRVALRAVLAGEASPADLLVPLADRLVLLPGDSGAESLYGLGSVDRARLHHRLCATYDGFDAVVVDAGSELEGVVRAAGIRASRLAVVVVPEPAALSDAYALIKIVNLQVPSVRLDVMVNRVAADEEGQVVFGRLRLAADRFLRRDLEYLGCVAESDAIRRGARRPGALLGMESEEIDGITSRLVPCASGEAGAGQQDSRGMAP